MTKAKARERAKKRALAKAKKPREDKAAKKDAGPHAQQHGPNKGADRAFGGHQTIKSAARSTRGAARSR